MFDDDYLNYLNNYTTTTDTDTEQNNSYSGTQTSASSQTASTYNPYASPYDSDYDDDYSVTQNYKEQSSYNSSSNYTDTEEQTAKETEVKRYRRMEMPVIEKQQEAVTLTKTRQKVHLEPRMKIAISMFSVILASLLVLIVWNFVSISNYKAMINEKQQTVNELSISISGLETTYTSFDEEYLKQLAENAGFVESDETNTYTASTGEFYTESEVEDLPSNWFNDVCEFFSKLFS